MPFFGVGPPPSLCSRRPHWTFIPLSPSCKAIVQVETRCLRSRCSMPFFRRWPPPPPLCSRRPHRTFIPLSPSCKAIIQVEMLSLCAHGSRYPLWRRTPPSLSSRRPHRTLVPLSPSYRAIVQVETRSLCAHGSQCPLWRRAAAVVVLSPSTLDVYNALAIVKGDCSSRDACFAFTVLDAILWP